MSIKHMNPAPKRKGEIIIHILKILFIPHSYGLSVPDNSVK